MADTPAPQLLHHSKSAAVYLELRRRILHAELPPASAINQEQLAAQLGVSTTPLREALRRLESEGLVLPMAHREAVVSPLDPVELEAIYEVREHLDPLAAALAAERHTEAEADEIRRATARMRKPGRDDPMSVNRRYHAAIYGACHNPSSSRRSTGCGTAPTATGAPWGSWPPSRRSRRSTSPSPTRSSVAGRRRRRSSCAATSCARAPRSRQLHGTGSAADA